VQRRDYNLFFITELPEQFCVKLLCFLKYIRLMIGTWNVAGKSPSDEMDLSEWLCTEEPADMYILG
jgi:hypothetical protein